MLNTTFVNRNQVNNFALWRFFESRILWLKN